MGAKVASRTAPRPAKMLKSRRRLPAPTRRRFEQRIGDLDRPGGSRGGARASAVARSVTSAISAEIAVAAGRTRGRRRRNRFDRGVGGRVGGGDVGAEEF